MWDCPVSQPLPCLSWSSSRSPATSPLCLAAISAPPTGLDECFFFNSLVVGLPYSSVFCQFWLFFVFKCVFVLHLVVQGGTVCLPMPPSWPEVPLIFSINIQLPLCMPRFCIHRLKIVFSICHWESTDAEGQLYALFYTISY